jgi:uncharacterized membrane protein (DUF485 family)
MDITDQNIKKIFSTYEEKYSVDPELEDSVMEKISIRKNYNAILLQSKRKAKMGIVISFLFFIVYIITTYYDLLNLDNSRPHVLNTYFLSISTVLVAFVLYIELVFSFSGSDTGVRN